MAPMSLLEAIQARYCSAAILAADQDAAVELPGAEKLVQQAADLPNLVQASVARMRVAVQDDADATLNLGPTDIGVSEALALAASWLPNLQHLVLHGDGGCVAAQEGADDSNPEACASSASAGDRALDLGQPIAPFPRHDALQSLDLSHRPDAIRGWEDVLELGRALPGLKTLNLAGARLRGVLGGTEAPPSAALSNLQTLLLGDAQLQTWAEVQSLDRLPSLSHLRVAGCPVWEAAGADARALTIARLGRLATLNGSAVGEAERKDAELWYVSLVKGSLTVQRLKTLLERLLGVPAAEQQLILQQGAGSEDVTACDARELNVFSIAPGSRMTVNRLDVEAELAARASEALALQASEQRRMDEQESQFQALHDEQRRLLG
ncbi:hypothetical protein QBZ16_000918 [Prototheca wickerhamii]|uniref:Ubiquitin-like domain-containing protein n=1 Tax=Prototheca wickerhamii TaxID=3111 RepID=A0AAD9IF60_PROWI|nr:hypothetical protein QBZ16_000918 [Prototheca wickerhamii]